MRKRNQQTIQSIKMWIGKKRLFEARLLDNLPKTVKKKQIDDAEYFLLLSCLHLLTHCLNIIHTLCHFYVCQWAIW